MTSRGLLRAMTITGGSQAIGVVMSIARIKVLAVLLGPTGVGVLSLYSSLQSSASTLAGLGLGSSGVRQIAQSRGDERELSRVRRVILGANLLQGVLAMVAMWLLRRPISVWLFGDPTYQTEVGVVGVAVLLALVSNSQTALLRGLRRIADLGRVTAGSALAGTVVGIAAVSALGMDGLLWFVLVQPLASVLVAVRYTRKLHNGDHSRPPASDIWRIWKPMVQLGAVFMLGALANSLTLLLVRSRIVEQLGINAAGQFAAAWGITVTYVGFLLNAMSMDYFPRLTEIIHDRQQSMRLINEQAQIALTIGGPVLLLLIGLAPAVITVLYSDKFGAAVSLLQWQTAGNVFKLASWPIGIAFAAGARSRVFFLVQINFNTIYSVLIWLGLPIFGLEVVGTAFLVAYAAHFTLLNILARRMLHFRWEPLSLALIGVHGGLAVLLLALSLALPLAGAGAAVLLFLGTGFVSGHILLEKIGPHPYAAPLTRVYAICRWPIAEQP